MTEGTKKDKLHKIIMVLVPFEGQVIILRIFWRACMGKYFGTDGFRGEANVGLTVDHAFKIGRFIGWY